MNNLKEEGSVWQRSFFTSLWNEAESKRGETRRDQEEDTPKKPLPATYFL
jgi:hypothetical protein